MMRAAATLDGYKGQPTRAAWTRWLALALWGICVALVALAPVLHQLNRNNRLTWGFQPGQALLALTSASVGALILRQRPRHPIGVIFFVAAFSQALSLFAPQYAIFALFTLPGTLPFGTGMAWMNEWIWAPGFIASSSFLLLLFPDGRLLTPHWRWAMAFATLAMLAWVLPVAIFFWPLRGGLLIAAGDGRNTQPIPNLAILVTVANTAFLLMAVSISLAAISVILRYRRSTQQVRRQLRWFLYATTIVGIDVIVGQLGAFSLAIHNFGVILDVFALPCLPIATGIAILRHRLYDIDIIINQTLVYGSLTATLGGIYLAGVVSLQALVRVLTQQADSPVPIVASTLAIAFLFQPVRQRIQDGIDRRFYRRKYDLRQTLATFAETLRDEVEIEQIANQLFAVLQATMQPASMSLWLRTPEPTKMIDAPFVQ